MVVVLVFDGVWEDQKYVIPPANQRDDHSAIVRSKASYREYS